MRPPTSISPVVRTIGDRAARLEHYRSFLEHAGAEMHRAPSDARARDCGAQPRAVSPPESLIPTLDPFSIPNPVARR